MSPALHVPSAVGRAAVADAELDCVAWGELSCAGGKCRPLAGERPAICDVRGQLSLLADANPYAAEEAKELLLSSIYSQGDLFEVTPYAVPFIAAYGAGDDVWNEGVDHMAALLAWIAESAATESRPGPRLNAAMSTRKALAASASHLRTIVTRRPPFRKAERAIAEIAASKEVGGDLLAMVDLEQLRYPVPW